MRGAAGHHADNEVGVLSLWQSSMYTHSHFLQEGSLVALQVSLK